MAFSIKSEKQLSSSVSSFRDKEDLNSISGSFNKFLVNFPKEVKRRDLIELYKSLRFAKQDEGVDIDAGVNALLALLFNESTPSIDRLIVIDCLQLIAPQPDLCEAMVNGDIKCLANSLPVALAQGPSDAGFKKIVDRVIDNLENPMLNDSLQQKILQFLGQIVAAKSLVLSTDQFKKVTHYAINKLKPSDSDCIVKELDGTITREMSTVLSNIENISNDEILRNQCFSFLLPWFENISDLSNLGENSVSNDPFSNLRLLELLTPENLNILKEYCFRIIDQSERNVLVPSDADVQKAALSEALKLLSLICSVNSEHTAECLSIVRRLHDRNVLIKQPSYPDVVALVATSQFLIRHSSIMMSKMDDIGPFLLRDTISLCYHDNSSSYEIVNFVRNNLAKLCYSSSLLEKYFPSLLKAVAWSSSTFEGDFLEILPSFLSPLTSVEAFHSLLDLPCMTASLILQQASLKQGDVMKTSGNPSLSGLEPSLLQIYGKAEYQAMFNYILRPASGMGDTFNRIESFHRAIEPLNVHPRVVSSAKTASALLDCFFEIVIQHADAGLASLLLPAMLDRLTLIYQVKGYSEAIQKVVASSVLKLFNKHPELIIHLHEEIADFVSEIKKVKMATDVFTHLVWAIGEYSSVAYTDLCKPEIVSKYYDGLETVIYELLSSSSDIETNSFPKLVCVVLTTIAELSSRSQELLPRAILCLSKAGQKLAMTEESSEKDELLYVTNKIVMDRINMLLATLRMPNVASLLLSPSKEIYSGKWHTDPTSLPVTLKTIVTLLHGDNNLN